MQTLEVISPLRNVPLHETPPLCGVHPSGNVCTADDSSYQLHVVLISGFSPNFQILWQLLSHQSLVIWLMLVPPVPPATEWVVVSSWLTCEHSLYMLMHLLSSLQLVGSRNTFLAGTCRWGLERSVTIFLSVDYPVFPLDLYTWWRPSPLHPDHSRYPSTDGLSWWRTGGH